MSLTTFLSAAFLAVGVTAQSLTPYTDEKTGITFNGLQDASGYRFGIALPETIGSDLVAQIVGPNVDGWAGASFASSMAAKLLIVAWPNGNEVVASFRQATGYTSPRLLPNTT